MERLWQDLRVLLKARDELHEYFWIESYVDDFDGKEKEIKLAELLEKKKRSTPLAYIFGNWAFRNLDLLVGPGVLIPRPETEELVDLVLGEVTEVEDKEKIVFADFGSGSGALGISIALNLKKKFPEKTIIAYCVEQSEAAFEYLKKNVHKCLRNSQVEMNLLNKSWGDFREDVDFIVSNPPYVSEKEYSVLMSSVKEHEPKEALVPAHLQSNGLESIQEIIENFADKTEFIFFEHGEEQAQKIHSFAESLRFKSKTFLDLSGKERFTQVLPSE